MSIDGQEPIATKRMVNLVRGAKPQIRISVRNPLRTPVVGGLELKIGRKGIGSQSFDIAPGASSLLVFDIPPEDVPEGTADGVVTIGWKDGGNYKDDSDDNHARQPARERRL